MRAILAFAMAMASLPALADEAEKVAEQAAHCWSIPAGVATFDVVFDGEGSVKDATVLTYEPKGAQGEEMVRSASRALEKCGPYNGVSEGTLRVVMDPKFLFPESIDPFKGTKPQ